ncbi:MAG: hypothetical protein KBC07_01005, partial [Bacteroidales bacterium]|jgi:hypothetical protein|nr:hypothetical protein [Bacteroidales bacterium]
MKKNNYFTKVEDKYVFNISLIVWHSIIMLASIAVVAGIVGFLWTISPTFKERVKKDPYPVKAEYPAPVAVTLSDLSMQKATPVAPQKEITAEPESVKEEPIIDTTGLANYNISLNIFKILFRESDWKGSGYWSYPYGQEYWDFYQKEKYRSWVVSTPSILSRLESSYKKTNADTYIQKKHLLDGYTNVIKNRPAGVRAQLFDIVIYNNTKNINSTYQNCMSLSKLLLTLPHNVDLSHINNTLIFLRRNESPGNELIDYTSSILSKVSPNQRVSVLTTIRNSYSSFFDQDFTKQKEATDMFLTLLSNIKENEQNTMLNRFYRVYTIKNKDRNQKIKQIEQDYEYSVNQIEERYTERLYRAQRKYNERKELKANYRYRTLIVVGSGVLLIVLIATILAFLSIQRSVRKIEDKLKKKSIRKL